MRTTMLLFFFVLAGTLPMSSLVFSAGSGGGGAAPSDETRSSRSKSSVKKEYMRVLVKGDLCGFGTQEASKLLYDLLSSGTRALQEAPEATDDQEYSIARTLEEEDGRQFLRVSLEASGSGAVLKRGIKLYLDENQTSRDFQRTIMSACSDHPLFNQQIEIFDDPRINPVIKEVLAQKEVTTLSLMPVSFAIGHGGPLFSDLESQLDLLLAGNPLVVMESIFDYKDYLQGVDLSGNGISGADLRYVNLRGANLISTRLDHVLLAGADLSGSNLTAARLESVDCSHAIFEDANLEDCHVIDSFFDDSILRRANLKGIWCTDVYFRSADLRGAILYNYILMGIQFEGASFEGLLTTRETDLLSENNPALTEEQQAQIRVFEPQPEAESVDDGPEAAPQVAPSSSLRSQISRLIQRGFCPRRNSSL